MNNLSKSKKIQELVEKARISIDALYTTEIQNFEERDQSKVGNKFRYTISFGGGEKYLKYNVIMNAIGAVGRIGDNIRRVENNKNVHIFIINSKMLSLIFDLWNIDKHGYPLDKPKTKYHPVLSNIRTGLTYRPNVGVIKYGIDEDTLTMAKNSAIKISFDVVDKNSMKKLADGDSLLKNSLLQFQKYINSN